MTVWLFGNPDCAPDAMPLKLLPGLKKRLPGVSFIVKDPHEEWDDIPNPLIIIDTVQGVNEITVFNSLDQFQTAPRVTVHDFDLGMKLKLLQKLDKLPRLFIIGLPVAITKSNLLEKVVSVLSPILHDRV